MHSHHLNVVKDNILREVKVAMNGIVNHGIETNRNTLMWNALMDRCDWQINNEIGRMQTFRNLLQGRNALLKVVGHFVYLSKAIRETGKMKHNVGFGLEKDSIKL